MTFKIPRKLKCHNSEAANMRFYEQPGKPVKWKNTTFKDLFGFGHQ